MKVVQTTFLNDERIEQKLMEGAPGLSYTGNGRLILARRRPLQWDWVNGEFVGDHEEPTDDAPHVHGEP